MQRVDVRIVQEEDVYKRQLRNGGARSVNQDGRKLSEGKEAD